ncbi:hypothetical protein BDQ12DRAFT_590122, partial [Crucibulum laeve]
MASFSNAPLEIITEIIDALQDDSSTLRSCSQTCLALLPLCRKYIFRSITLTCGPRPRVQPRKYYRRGTITSFRKILDSDPVIADYVQNIIYRMGDCDIQNGDEMPRILGKLHRVRSFKIIGCSYGDSDWNKMHRKLRESLSRIIQSSVTHLEMEHFRNLPITIFIPWVKLTSLTLKDIQSTIVNYKTRKNFSPELVPQLQSFNFGVDVSRYVMSLVEARRCKDLPVIDFSHLQTLVVKVADHSDREAVNALIKVTEMLENLHYEVNDFADGYKGLAASINPSSFSTLKRLYLHFHLRNHTQDPLCGIDVELKALSGLTVIEEIDLDATVNTSNELGKLDSVLATGFPFLKQLT